MNIRPFDSKDRTRLKEIITSIANFNGADKAIALELIDDVIAKEQKSDYIIYVCEDETNIVQAYVCFGKTPLTESTFDFYWCVVDQDFQRHGLGFRLFQFVETEVQRLGGKLLMCETSSLDSYDRVLKLYEKLGYQFVARIKNFYREGDDKFIYMKDVSQRSI
ncbi:MAG: hypothetical protein C5B54_03600 [Acidobacteria bacterium]|nr:MAG: hypothetical protein C5B54_03600 [Acidobacteriota bacterium]